MATANIANTKVVPASTVLKPYYDDFDETKNFHRILFRPGYAVQARELTQLQTILQNQIERFGNHIFQNGSIVLGGGMSIDNDATYINLQSTYAGTSIVASDMINQTLTYSSGNAYIRAYVYAAKEATSTEPPVLMIKYFTGDQFGNSSSIKTESNVYANIATTNHTGKGTLASINDGIFFMNGYFIKVPEQTIIVDKYSTQANAKIGLEFSEDIITNASDSTLLDPAQESSNYQAPGASRLQINFDLVTRSLDSTDDAQFIELMRLENGIVKKQVKYPLYSEIGDTLARRTFDESGNYTVRRFVMRVEDHPTDNTKLQLVVDPGKAYIKGYEYENIAQERINIDKARDFVSVNNEDVSINFGNYLTVSNVTGFFNVASMAMVHLHSVPYQNVDFSSTNKYNSTKMASARVRELKFYTAANTQDANTIIQTMSLFDTQFGNLRTNVSTSVTANGFDLYDITDTFSANDNAYNGSTLRIYDGPGRSEKYTISGYTGLTKTINVTPGFITTPTSSSYFSIDHSIKSVDSVVANTNQTSSTTEGRALVSIYSKDNNAMSGNTYLTDTTFNSLIFPWASRFIKSGITDQNFSYLATSIINFSGYSADILLPSGETFAGVSDGTGRSTSTLQNFAIYRPDGERLNLSTVTVDNGLTTPKATVVNGDIYNGTAYAYYIVNVNSGSKTIQRQKTKVSGNTNIIIPIGTMDLSASVTTSSGTTTSNVYLADAQVTISNPSKTPGERMSLYISDVLAVNKIYDLAGAAIPASGSSLTGYTDVTALFTLDNGQRDTHYDHATIALNPRTASVSGPLVVCLDYYTHDAGAGGGTSAGYFSVDSYPSYEDISTYIDSSGNEISLRDVIDFRPRRVDATTAYPGYSLQGVRIPISETSFSADYSYYLARKSHLTLTTDSGQAFKVVDGVSSKNPQEPRLGENSMLLYKLSLEPYTINKTNVSVTFVENKRYTMRDIGRLETRIENLEYYQSLSVLETSASRMKILDDNGLERTKYGFIADDFSTHGYGDVADPDYLISVDKAIGGLQPAQQVIQMDLFEAANNGTKTLGPFTTLSFTEEEFVSQTLATKFTPVQPYMISQWVGTISMNPPDDMWTSVTKAPDVLINLGDNDALVHANTIIRLRGRKSRARWLRANNVFMTEANWWLRFFGAAVSR